MKTRQEMIYEFMVALAANPKYSDPSLNEEMEVLMFAAESLADEALCMFAGESI
jgi:hypothetical protein